MNFSARIFDVLPAHWTYKNYSKVRFVLDDIEKDNTEYKTVTKMFFLLEPSKTANKIQRVQHPYAFTAYLATKEYLYKKSCYDSEKQLIVQVCTSCVNKYLEFNCDKRRKCIYSCSSGNKPVYVVVRSLKDISAREIYDYSSMYFYPEYIIFCEQEAQDTISLSNFLSQLP